MTPRPDTKKRLIEPHDLENEDIWGEAWINLDFIVQQDVWS